MENNIKIARAHRAISWLYVLIIALLLLILFFHPHDELKPPLDIKGICFGLVFSIGLFALHYATSKAAKSKKNWARNMSRGIGMLLLAAIPVGTVIGIYLLVYTRGWDSR